MPRRFLAWSILVATVLAALIGAVAPLADARQASPTPGTPPAAGLPGVTSDVLGRGRPDAVPDLDLAVGRVVIEPGATIPPHEHPGTQVAAIVSGELTYTVLTGEVALTRAGAGSADGTPSGTDAIVAGETVVLRAGDAVVEQRGAFHTARNAGAEPVVIVVSTLFEPDEPRSILATGTPVAGTVDAGTDETSAGFVGAWRVTPTIAGQAAVALTTFMADGTIFTSNRPVQPAPAGLPADLIVQSLGHGAWSATDDGTATVTFVVLQTDPGGTFLGTRTINGVLALDAGGEGWTGMFTATVAGPDGAVIETATGTVAATRIVAAAPAPVATPAAAA